MLRHFSFPLYICNKGLVVMTKYTKEQAIKIITDCSEKYKNELVNKTLLFICADKHKHIVCYEFSFYGWNFMHLTGVKINVHDKEEESNEHLSAMDFYNKCLSHKLSPKDFEFSEDGTTHMKLDILTAVLCKNLNAKMIGTYNSSKPYLYTDKIAGSTKACIGFVIDSIQGCYVPNTLLKDDIRHNVYSYVQVVAAFRKTTSEQKYNELTYRAKQIEWDKIKLPEGFEYLSSLIR